MPVGKVLEQRHCQRQARTNYDQHRRRDSLRIILRGVTSTRADPDSGSRPRARAVPTAIRKRQHITRVVVSSKEGPGNGPGQVKPARVRLAASRRDFNVALRYTPSKLYKDYVRKTSPSPSDDDVAA
ncbi:hypothetical protein GCM10017687_70710 [Streptomyces echinatus]